MDRRGDVEELIEHSSLGTEGARALRARTTDADAAAFRRRREAHGRPGRRPSRRTVAVIVIMVLVVVVLLTPV